MHKEVSSKIRAWISLPNKAISFTDAYLSLTPGNAAYIGDKSIVIHYANKTRLACANFVTSSNYTATASGSTPTGAASTLTNGPVSTSSIPSTSTQTANTTSSSAAANSLQTAAGSLLGLLAIVGLAGL
jgi:hypothetical protein